MRAGDIFVKVDGVHMRSLGHVSQIAFGTRFGDGPCGPDLASVQIELDPRNDTGFLRLGRVLEVFDRGVKVFGGRISEIERGTPRTIRAKGWARVAWDATLNPEPGARIGRTADNVEFTPAAETSPRWLLDASDMEIGVADDRLYTQVIATYATAVTDGEVTATTTTTADDAIAQDIFGVIPFELDLTPLLLIPAATAHGYAEQQLREFAIPEWASRVTTNSDRLLTLNGHRAHLPDVKAGQVVRMFGLPATYGGLRRQAATDVVLGEVEYSTASPDEITLAPQRVAVRSIADAVRAMAEARKAQEAA